MIKLIAITFPGSFSVLAKLMLMYAVDFQDVTFGDLDLYSEDAWMSVSVSFNPYQCDLSPLTVSSS